MKKIILFTLLAFCLQVSFAQKDKINQRKERKTERNKSDKKRLGSKKGSHYVAKPLDTKLYKAGKQKLENMASQYYDTTGTLDSNYISEFKYDVNGFETVTVNKYLAKGASQPDYRSKMEYTRDSIGYKTSVLTSLWNSKKGWVVDTKEEFSYERRLNIAMYQRVVFREYIGVLKPVSKIEYGYDLSDNLITDTYYKYDTTKKVFDLIDQYSYTYDASGNRITDTYSTWNAGTKKYEAVDKYFNTYDTKNNLTRKVLMDWVTNKFVNSTNDTFAYDANKNMLINTYSEWDALKSKWTPVENIVNDYDGKNNQTKSTTQAWDTRGSKWADSYKSESTFDSQVSTSDLILPFDEETINLYFKTKLNETIDYDWNKALKAWVKNTNTTYNYKTESGSIITPGTKFNISVYPNPSHDKIYVEVQNYTAGLEVKIYDIGGKVILSNHLTEKGFIDIEALKTGVYIVQINDGQTLLGNRKLVIN